jgi:SAM-dependent methyltransferase
MAGRFHSAQVHRFRGHEDLFKIDIGEAENGPENHHRGHGGCFPIRAEVLTPVPHRLQSGRALAAPCGTGAVAQHLVDGGHDVVGVDVSEAMRTRARKAVPGVISPVCR